MLTTLFLRHQRRGQASIEFAFLAAPLLVLLIAIVTLFLWFSTWNEWHYAAVQGTVFGTAQGATQLSTAQATIDALSKVSGSADTQINCTTNASATLVAHYYNGVWSCQFNGNPCLVNGASYAASFGTYIPAAGSQIWICVPPIPQNASCSNNGTASVYVSGFIPAPAPLPSWSGGITPSFGAYITLATADTEAVQVPEGDAIC